MNVKCSYCVIEMVKMSTEMRETIEKQPYIVVSTITPEGMPHMIVASDKWIVNDALVLGRWQMVKTEENLKKNPIAIAIVIDPDKRRSVRFFGEGTFKKKEELQLPENANNKEYLVIDIKRIQYGQWGADTNVDFASDETWKGKFGFKRTRVIEE